MIGFLLTAVAISLSGVLAPGPMTAAALAAGTRSRHAGVLLALGHAVVEFPLMVVIVAGAGALFERQEVKIAIGLAGGVVLLLMGAQMLRAVSSDKGQSTGTERRHPFLTGILLSGANPYFLIWWATVGLALATQAVELGILAFALFAVVHWLCDLVWLEALSLAAFRGTELLGARLQRAVLAVCAVMLLAFGCKFVYDAGSEFARPSPGAAVQAGEWNSAARVRPARTATNPLQGMPVVSDDLFSVQDQVVLISGASRGIGRAIAQGFAGRGATVIISGRVSETVEQTASEISPPGGVVRAKVCDVADTRAGRRMVDEVVDEFGRIDTLVNCAGVNRRMKVEEYTEDVYDFITNINIRGAFFLSLAAGRHMIQAKRGCQINIDSINSHTPLNRVAVYAMAKAAMSQMTKCLAMEWGPHGVRVNAVAPGFTFTELARPVWEGPGGEQMTRWRQENTPLRRVGLPEDMVGACIFLASEAASFVTGQVLYIDGGTVCGLFWPIPV